MRNVIKFNYCYWTGSDWVLVLNFGESGGVHCVEDHLTELSYLHNVRDYRREMSHVFQLLNFTESNRFYEGHVLTMLLMNYVKQ